MNRRRFTKKSVMAGIGLCISPSMILKGESKKTIFDNITEQDIRKFLSKKLYTRKEVDDYFSFRNSPYAKHSPEFGWLLRDCYRQDGINKSRTVYRYKKPDGERIMHNYADQPCRINTYGNSFTHGDQVSDYETWQEVIAAHLQEPVKNFGIGGWSVFQAYLRMLKEEKRTPVEYIIFNIYMDDHFRNLDAWRNIRVPKHKNFIEPPLPFLKVDYKNKTFSEHPNPTPTKDDFYKLCDLNQSYKLFKDDFVTKVMIAHQKSVEANENLNYEEIQALTTAHGIETSLDTNITMSKVVNIYHQKCALFSTEKIIEKIEQFASNNNKKILYVLSYPASYIAKAYNENKRWDQSFIDFIKSKDLPLVDLGKAHLDEYKQFNISIHDYLKKYFIGHYNPIGNMFCAQAVTGELIKLLNPKPKPYQYDTNI